MKVLAIYPEARELQAFETMPPLGLAWVAAAIKPHVKEICIIDQQVDRTSVTDTVSQMKPDFVFLGGTSHSRQEVFDLSTQVKTIMPHLWSFMEGLMHHLQRTKL